MKWALRIPGTVFMLLCAFPVLLLSGPLCGYEVWPLMGLLLPGMLAAVTMQNLVPHLYRPVGIAAILAWSAALFFLLGGGLLALVMAFIMLVLQFLTLALSHRFDWDFVSVGAGASGGAVYAIVYITLYLSQREDTISLLSGSFLLYLAFCFLALNHTSMRGSSGLAKRPPSGLSAGNRLLSAGVLVVAFAFMNINTLKYLFGELMKYVILIILFLINILIPDTTGSGGGGGGQDMDLSALGEGGQMAPWLELLLRIVGIALFAAAMIALLILIGRAVVKLIRRALAAMGLWLRKTGKAVEVEEYEEERSFLLRSRAQREEEPKGPTLWQRLLTRTPKWKDLDNRSRVRFVVRQRLFPKKQPPVNRTLTAKEALGEQLSPLASLYDKARYSDLPITDQEAEESRQYIP